MRRAPRSIARAATHPVVLYVVSQMLGDDFHFCHTPIVNTLKPTRDLAGAAFAGQAWHADYPYRSADFNAAGGAPFAIVAKKARPRLLQLMLERGGADPNAIDSMGWSTLHILALATTDRGGTTEDWQRTLKSDRETAEATRVRQHGDVIDCVEIKCRIRPTG